MFSTIEFSLEQHFGDLLDQYHHAIIKKLGLIASKASSQLLQQLKNPNSYVIGLISPKSTPIGFTFLHTEGEKYKEGNIDLLFIIPEYESPRTVKLLLNSSIDFMRDLNVRIIRYLSPSLGAMDINTHLEDLQFESIIRFKFSTNTELFREIQVKLPQSYKIDSWRKEYALPVAKLISDGYYNTIEALIFPQFTFIDQVMIHLNKLQNYPNQGIIKEASLVCLHRGDIIATQIIIRIDEENALIWQLHVKEEYRGSPIAHYLFESSLRVLYLLKFSQVTFSTPFEKLANYCLKKYPDRVKLIEKKPLYFFKLKQS
ncbi:MAG: hypothetical protein EAX86_10945 [Candidatus Heimdallarchaeota archaeon]|nr:hypothetical protein [Candidatus Heimdallarchaeota archaeon]